MSGETPQGPYRPGRRTVVRGAAWTVPAVAVASTAPAFAASPCTTSACPDISFGAVTGTGSDDVGVETSGNKWSANPFPGSWSNRGTANPVGFRAATTGGGMTTTDGSWFAATAGPTTKDQRITLTQTGQPQLAAGCSYQITIGLVVYDASPRALTLRTFVGTTEVGAYTTNTSTSGGTTSYTNRGTRTYSVPSAASGAVSFRFDFSGAGNAQSDNHADIKLYNPSVTCA